MTLFGFREIWKGLPRRGEASIVRSPQATGATCLAGIRPGRQAKILGFSANLPPDRLAHLQAYGLLPGRRVQVLQHTPVTVVQIEHFELALERELARGIQVEEEQFPSFNLTKV